MKRRFLFFLSLALVFGLLFTSISTNNVNANNNFTSNNTEEEIRINKVKNKENFKFEALLPGNNVFASVTDVNIAVLDELKRPLKIKNNNVKYFGIYNNNGEMIPLYIVSDNDLDEKTFEKIAKDTIKTYKSNNKNNNNKDTNVTISAFDLEYVPASQTLHVYVGSDVWYTEYRVYKGGEFVSTDYFYLRSDHQSLDHTDAIIKYLTSWTPQETNIDILDPQPADSDDNTSLTFGLPLSVSWTIETNDEVDVETELDIANDTVEWEFDNWSWLSMEHVYLFDVRLGHGIEIESPTTNNGFNIDVKTEIWEITWGTINPNHWWTDTIVFTDSAQDLDLID